MAKGSKKANFTAQRVAAFPCEPGRQQSIYWDAETPGLGVRVTVGSRTYIYESRLHGRTLRISIGAAHAWPLKKARTEAARLRVLVDAGTDPREQEAEHRAAAEAKRQAARRDEVTVREAWAVYLEHLRTAISPKTKKPRSARYLADHEALAAPGGQPRKRGRQDAKTVAGPLASLLDLRLADLTAPRVAAWLEVETAQRPTNAAHAYRLLKAFIRWTADHDDYAGIVGADAWQSHKVTGLVPQSKAKAGGSLQREQLRAWFKAVKALDNPVASAYLQATLICGARREEMAALRWDDVDFRWGGLHLRDKVETLTGRDVPLPPYLASVLAALPRRNEWVFSSPTAEDGKIAEPRFSHNRALAAAGLPHLTIHDLRRSFGTLSEWVECPVGIVAQIQGHAASALAEKHYRRRPLDLLRVWHTKIEAWMLEQAGIDFKPEDAKQGLRALK
ncbi:integrase family protein [Paraburkholderia sp. CNPSo 3281]|uniref:tyrosine-type recombinase/integrase n=1 Tax=Paraburkholderia sp. CNPSo 3281 TaxID=2940933 RepID=UPI0020B822AF|nr:integrase family protein [Paraburkholderia sp. CNPSo 3281]MCP3713874.1 integrase family protein [Paraburkholderia sp. CNPSo 3281]